MPANRPGFYDVRQPDLDRCGPHRMRTLEQHAGREQREDTRNALPDVAPVEAAIERVVEGRAAGQRQARDNQDDHQGFRGRRTIKVA